MFKALAVHLSLIVLGFGLSGCLSVPHPHAPLNYTAQAERLKAGPPLPAAADVQTSGGLRLDPVKIDPSQIEIFKTLPTSVTAIYDRPPTPLSLGDVVVLDLANDINIKLQGYSLRIAEYEVPAAWGIYDLLLTGNWRYTRTERQSGQPPTFGVARGRGKSGELALSQLFPTGTLLTVTYDANQSAMNNYSNETAIEVTQPLLQGWEVTGANIQIATLASQGSLADYRTTLEDQLQSALSIYWNLVGAIQALKVNQISYAAARDLLRANQAKFDVGMLAIADLLQTQAAVDARYDAIIQSRQRVRELEDNLKRLILDKDRQAPEWAAQIQPTTPIVWPDLRIDLDAAVATALRARPEVAQARIRLEQTRVRERVALNNRLPVLDLVGSLLPNGLGSGYDESFRNMREAKAMSYSLGLQFSYPLQNRAARYRYKQAVARVAQAEESLKDVRDQVTLDVRLAAREYASARARIFVSQSQIISQAANLATEQLRLQVGLSTTFRVLQFQQDLASAQLDHILAVIQANQAAITLERARGTLLETYGVYPVQAAEPARPAAQPTRCPLRFSKRFPFITLAPR